MINYFSSNIDKITKAQKLLLFLLVALIPYHYMVICIFLKDIPMLKLWKEVIICILFMSVVLKRLINKSLFKLSFVEVLILIFIFINAVYIVISPNIVAAISVSRIYILPMLLLYVVKNVPISKEDIDSAVKLLIINACFISIFGILQQFLLGDDFLMKIGYELHSSYDYPRLTDSFYMSGAGLFQRNTATFVSPNVAGVYFSFIFTFGIVLFNKLSVSKPKLVVMLSIILLSIVLTFSRTSWIALFFGILLYFTLSIKWSKKKVLCLFVSLGLSLLCIFIFDYFFMDNKLYTLIYNTITLKDTSIVYHLSSLSSSLDIAISNIFGCGLGSNGPRALAYFTEPQLTESSYFLLFFELGILGFTSYFSIALYSLKNSIAKLKNNSYILLSILIVIETLIAFISLPYIQDVEITIILFVCLGYMNLHFLCNNNDLSK